jgi:hypothetical protein
MDNPLLGVWLCGCGSTNAAGVSLCRNCGLARPLVATAAPPPLGMPLSASFRGMMAHLVGVSQGAQGKVFRVEPSRPVLLGRDAGMDIQLPREPSVSGTHARIYWANPYHVVEDLGSSGGTFVNGQPVLGHTVLRHGDMLTLGSAQFCFVVESQPAAMPLAPASLPGYPAVSPYGAGAYNPPRSRDRITAGILAILLGPLGIHLFYLNQAGWGIAFLLVTLLTCGWGALLTYAIAFIQGVLYLCCTDADFEQKYVWEHRFM